MCLDVSLCIFSRGKQLQRCKMRFANSCIFQHEFATAWSHNGVTPTRPAVALTGAKGGFVISSSVDLILGCFVF